MPGYEASAWHAVLAPSGTPDAIVQKLNQAITQVLSDPALKDRLAQDGIEAVGSSSEVFSKAMLAEIDKWNEVVRQANITLD